MNRRGFLQGILAAGMAPAIVKAANIMPVFMRRESGLLAPEEYLITGIYGRSILTLSGISIGDRITIGR